jgi:hypothetical protein
MNTHISMPEWAPFLSVSVNRPFNPCILPETCEETRVDQSLQTDTLTGTRCSIWRSEQP